MLLTSLLLANSALSAPFSGCTMLSDRLVESSWPGGLEAGCLDLHIDQGACTKTKVVGNVVVNYEGAHVHGWLPAWFIEVSPYPGRSAFAEDWDGEHLEYQLELALDWWEKATGTLDFPGWSDEVARSEGVSGTGRVVGTWHARTIKVPYAGETWTLVSIGVAPGSAFPACFAGLSEFSPDTWADLPSQPEAPAATLHAPLHGLCTGATSALMGVEPTGEGSGWSQFKNPKPAQCAFPVTRTMATLATLQPGSEAMEVFTDPRKVCMGRLGPLLPRTGVTLVDDPRVAAETVAYRMASLAADHFLSGPGIEPGDRWQVVWPPVADTSCFQPGAFRPAEALLGRLYTGLPMTDGPRRPLPGLEGESTMVIAVWRRFDRCVEPFQGPLLSAEASTTQPVRQAACDALTTGQAP